MSTFEFTIRVLGGLLSGYHLSGDERLLKKATEAGDIVFHAFKNSTVLPHVLYLGEVNYAGKSEFEDKNGQFLP